MAILTVEVLNPMQNQRLINKILKTDKLLISSIKVVSFKSEKAVKYYINKLKFDLNKASEQKFDFIRDADGDRLWYITPAVEPI